MWMQAPRLLSLLSGRRDVCLSYPCTPLPQQSPDIDHSTSHCYIPPPPPPHACCYRYVSQHQQHSALLSQFGELSAALSSVPLPPQLVTPQWRVLADLQPRVRLAEWHEQCGRSHQHFAQKVKSLAQGTVCVGVLGGHRR